jgi:hypothetical protein
MIEWFLTSVRTVMSKTLGMSLSEENLLELMIVLPAREPRKKTKWAFAVHESRKKKKNIAVLIPAVSTVHVAPPSTSEIIDTK